MSLYKNTNIKDNQLSDLDAGQVLKDSHNKEQHSLDVTVTNSSIPVKYSKEVIEYNSNGQVVGIKYYGDGVKNQVCLEIPSIYSFSVALLNGLSFYLYDTLNKKTCVWFDVDNTGAQPVVAADSFLKVKISSSNTLNEVCLILSSQINTLDFVSSSSSDSTLYIDWRRVGATLGAIDIDTTFTIVKKELGRNTKIVWEEIIEYNNCGKVISVDIGI